MTGHDVGEFVKQIDGLDVYVHNILREGLDGEGLLQLAWLLDPPDLVDGAEEQAGGMVMFLRLVKQEFGISKQAHGLRLAHHVRRVCAGAI
eukprot:CAMPEP_0179467850 /NCGR_PEP_ID=MMETSP0799-20121207/48888_1 /TAXON_ID=46947 /ORGANISM="Geminigera cryophila, Strain CCMP2564" /LENGTH=90 /DNA_ID=CAMNT_0021273489 /DNA_START=35 /DNA_END=307 /DNA_ORIENTATION=+